MRQIQRENLKAPAKVVDIEMTKLAELGPISVAGYRSLWCLSRVRGLPASVSFWDVEDQTEVRPHDLSDNHCLPEFIPPDNPIAGDRDTADMSLTVAMCTRDRPDELRRALESLRVQSDDNFEVLVVDNAPSSTSSAAVVEAVNLKRCTYVVEPDKGLSRARNTAVAHVKTDYMAWIDDDEAADPDWVRRLKLGFAHPCMPAAVCGVMLPAELETEAQVRFEQYGGFNKGRGISAEILSVASDAAIRPLYPLPAIGSGGNMAFRMTALRSAGPFDEHLGAGTRTHGGEETRLFALLLRAGEVVLHWPEAITWHYHRREMDELHRQFYGYSAGLSAFYASMIRSDPSVIFDILRIVPNALSDLGLRSGGIRSDQLPQDFPRTLLSAGRKGLLTGAFNYAFEVLTANAKEAKRSSAIVG